MELVCRVRFPGQQFRFRSARKSLGEHKKPWEATGGEPFASGCDGVAYRIMAGGSSLGSGSAQGSDLEMSGTSEMAPTVLFGTSKLQ